MRQKHYHVLVGLPGGYMADSNDRYDSRDAAVDGALWHVRNLRDEGSHVRGSGREGYWRTTDDRTTVRISRCTLADCTGDR